MKLRIYNGCFSRSIQQHLIKWALRELFGKKVPDIKISIYYDLKKIKKTNKKEWKFKHVPSGYFQRVKDNYKIVINPHCNLRDILLVTFHELTHCKQRVKKELESYGPLFYWKNKEYDVDGLSSKEYINLPWEKEAYKNEVRLYKKYMKLPRLPT